MQRIGESRWRPLELCYWPDQGALPAKGKEYPGLGYKRLRDKPPKAQQLQQPAEAQDCNSALDLRRAGEDPWRPVELCWWPHQARALALGKEYPGLGFKKLRDQAPNAQAQQPVAQLYGFFGAAAAAKDVHQPVLATRRNTTLLEPQPPPPQTAQAYRALLFRGVGGALAAGAAIAVLVSAALHTGLWLCSGSWTQLGASWLAVELCFYVYYQAHCAELDAQPVPHAPTHQDPVLHFKRIYAHAKFLREVCHTPINWRHYLSTWFCGAPVSQIKLGNLREMVAYGFYYATPSQLQAEGRWHEVCSMVDQLTLIAAPEPHPTPTLTVPTPPSTMYRTPPPGAAGTSTFPDYQGQTQSQSHRNHHHPAYLHPPLSTDPALSYSSSSSSSSSSSTITTTTTSSSSGGGSSPGDVEQVMAAAVRQRALDPAEEGSVVLREGYTPGLRFMAHLWEPLRYSHRPLLLYLAIEALHCLTWGFLAACGFQRHRHLSTTFYFRNTTTAHDLRPGGQRGGGGVAPQPPTSPLLLLHGVGLGLLPYLLLICQLAAAGGAILAPEVGHVSLRLCRTVPTACQVAAKVVAMMDRLRMPPACVVAHSYGTFVASRLVQAHGARAVRSLALIDPVCFGMFLPSLLYSFVYRTPWSAFKAKGLWAAFKASFIHLVARDVHAAATFCRRFYWTDVNLWAEELPARCLVVLAGKDELLHAEESSQAAKRGAQARVLWHPTASHAGFLFNPAWQVSGGGHGGGVKGEGGPRAHDVVSGEGRSRGGLDGKGDVAQQQQWAGSGSGKGVTGALSKPLASFVSVPCPGRQWEEAVAACGSAGGGSSKQLHQVVAALRGMIDSANSAHAAQ
ncbi:hypothetical protein QJQ45_008275 [Haematococcus lacustris]|nr:hypothetical protein QJQ45_008275 [Haematococcus lacustris]